MRIESIRSAPKFGNKIQTIKCSDKDSVWDHNDNILRLWMDEDSVSKVLKTIENKRIPNIKKLYILKRFKENIALSNSYNLYKHSISNGKTLGWL